MISPPLRFADLAGVRVGVWGLGVEGRATLRRLESIGVRPSVLVDETVDEAGVLRADDGGLEALGACEVVVKSPGISRHDGPVGHLEEAGVAVVGGLGMWLEEVGPERVIGVTGTKGKSTTVSVAAHLACGLGVDAVAGGNLGRVPWDPEGAPTGGPDLWVIEVSSYQATDLWSSPAVAAVTSLHPDHLTWHGSVERYYADKLSLCGRPGSRITVASAEDARLVEREAMLRPGPRWVGSAGAGSWAGALGLRGAHNEVNAAIAAACLEEMGVDGAGDPERLATAAAGFAPLPHRLETVAWRGGVEFVDDSLSTNVLPTLAAVEAFAGRPLALIAGGFDRSIDYTPLGRAMAARPDPTVVFTLPDNGDRIGSAVTGHGGEARPCRDLEEAVQRAAGWVTEGGVVLLSPAAASFGRYRNYRERGLAFLAAVERLP
jgi:UDP-N-acetylmuramoylalanine--D-glutamate ligase